jgi:hypothetical protein
MLQLRKYLVGILEHYLLAIHKFFFSEVEFKINSFYLQGVGPCIYIKPKNGTFRCILDFEDILEISNYD